MVRAVDSKSMHYMLNVEGSNPSTPTSSRMFMKQEYKDNFGCLGILIALFFAFTVLVYATSIAGNILVYTFDYTFNPFNSHEWITRWNISQTFTWLDWIKFIGVYGIIGTGIYASGKGFLFAIKSFFQMVDCAFDVLNVFIDR